MTGESYRGRADRSTDDAGTALDPERMRQLTRAVGVLVPFVQEWKLPLNPGDLTEMAWAVLEHAAAATSIDAAQDEVRAQISEFIALMAGRREAWQGDIDRTKEPPANIG